MPKKMLCIYVAIHILILGLLTGFVYFAVLSTDDYAFAVSARNNTIWSSGVNMFNNWGGRYAQAWVATAWYKIAEGYDLSYSTGLLIFILLLFSGIYAFLAQVFGRVLKGGGILVFSLVILSGLLRGFPTLDESIYWNIGGITYLLPATLFLYILSLYLYNFRSNGRHIYLVLPLVCILILFCNGINEAFVIMNVLVLLGFMLYLRLNGREYRAYIIPFVVALAGIVVIIMARGNAQRMNYYPESGKFLYSVFWGGLGGTQSILQALADPYIWGSILLFIPLFLRLYAQISGSGVFERLLPVYVLTFLLMLYGTVALHYYATGNRPVQRLMVVWYIVFILGLLPIAGLIAPYLERFYKLAEGIILRVIPSKTLIAKILFAVVLLCFLLINNPPKAVYDLVYNIPGFVREMDEYESQVRLLQESADTPKELVVRKFSYRPLLLKAPTDANYGIEEYFGFDSVKILPKEEK